MGKENPFSPLPPFCLLHHFQSLVLFSSTQLYDPVYCAIHDGTCLLVDVDTLMAIMTMLTYFLPRFVHFPCVFLATDFSSSPPSLPSHRLTHASSRIDLFGHWGVSNL